MQIKLEAKNLNKSYDDGLFLFKRANGKHVLTDVSFQLMSGEILGVVGSSGSGKSTLARLLAMIEQPDSGDIALDGKTATKPSRKSYRRSVQMILQDSLSSFNPCINLLESLSEPLDNHFKLTKQEKYEQICDLLTSIGLHADLLMKFPSQLSGGELQRMNIARSLLLKPEVLICDEIVSSQDVLVQSATVKLLRRLNRETGLSILFISHDIRLTMQLCRRVLVMENGKIVETMEGAGLQTNAFSCAGRRLLTSLPALHPKNRTCAGIVEG